MNTTTFGFGFVLWRAEQPANVMRDTIAIPLTMWDLPLIMWENNMAEIPIVYGAPIQNLEIFAGGELCSGVG